MRKIQDRIDEVLSEVEDIGHQWQMSNAHGHATAVGVGSMVTGEQVRLPMDEEQLRRLEVIGAEALFKAVPIMVYNEIVMHYAPKPPMMDMEDEDND